MNTEKDNAEFLRNSVDENIVLPESLLKENIEKLVSGKKQKSSKKGIIRRFVAVGVAACIAVAATAVLRNSNFTLPFFTAQVENSQEAADETQKSSSHAEIISLIRAYAAEVEEENEKTVIFNYAAAAPEAAIGAVDDEEMQIITESDAGSVINGTADTTASSANRGELNLREKDVLENDIFINDGEYLYYININSEICIVKAEEDGTLTETAVIESSYPELGYRNISGLYRYNNYLIACFSQQINSSVYESKWQLKNLSGAVIYDISDKSAPKEVKTVSLDGFYSSSRIVDGKLILVSTYDITRYYSGSDDELLLPCVYNGDVRTAIPAESIICTEDEDPECYVIVSTLLLDDINQEEKTVSFLGHSSDTYCTKETLYILGEKYTYRNVNGSSFATFIGVGNADTTITAVDITGNEAVYKNRTEIGGSILNSYSIDEYNGYLRMAVNKENENLITVLDKNLKKVGEISGIAKGEQIKSARFMGDMAYVVTFVQTDPLFVIDLSNPEKPEIKGEVKLPGFSSYLHPVGEGLLAGIGSGGTEDGLDGSAKISLFDVNDPASPKEIDSFILENASFETNPKAYTSVTENSFLIPYCIWGTYMNGYSDGRYRTGALWMEVKDGKLSLKMDYCAVSPYGTSRATFIDDTVYIYETFSGVASFNMESGELISTLTASRDSVNSYASGTAKAPAEPATEAAASSIVAPEVAVSSAPVITAPAASADS